MDYKKTMMGCHQPFRNSEFFEVFIIKYLLMKSFMFNLRLVSTWSNSTLWTCYCMIRHSNVIQAVYRNECYSGYVPQWMLFRPCPPTNAIQAVYRNECYSGWVPQRMLFRLCTAMNAIQAMYRNECYSGCVPQRMLLRLCTANCACEIWKCIMCEHVKKEQRKYAWSYPIQFNPIKHV